MPESEQIETKHETKKTLLSFELPEVSEQTSDFIDSDEEQAQPENETVFTQVEEQEETDQFRGLMDEKGNAFDPTIHKTPPEKTPTGRWKRLSKTQKQQTTQKESNAVYAKAAQNAAVSYANLHVSLFGKEGYIEKDALPMLSDALEAYFIENGVEEFDPKWQVLIAAGNYSTIVCTREKNADKLKAWFNPLFKKVKSLFGFAKNDEQEKE